MRIIGKITVSLGALVLAGAALAGCASSSAIAADVKAPIASELQNTALADGVVERGEYERGFANYQACMSSQGYKVLVLDDTSTIVEMRIPAEGVESGADARCYVEEFSAIDDGWQVANQDSREDNALLDACLVDNGLIDDVSAAPTSRQEKVDRLLEAKVDLASCLPE